MDAAAPEPLVTVVIPTYDRAGTVMAAVASVLRQEGPSFEVVVVDDGSADDTLAQLRAECTDPRVRLIAAPHGGVCAARNRGAAEARGQWLTFLDSDDTAAAGWLAGLLCAVDERTQLVSGTAVLRYPDGSTSRREPEALGPAFGSITARFLAGTFMVATELFRTVGGYLDGLEYGENTELGMRLGTEIARRGMRAAAEPAALVEVAAVHRPYDAARYYRSGVDVLARAGEQLARDPHLLATYCAITGVAAGRCGHTAEARRLLWRAWRIEPLAVRHGLRLVRSQLPIRSLR